MAQAPTGDETLSPNDAVHILDVILPAKYHSHILGIKLGLPQHVVDGIHSKEMEPERYLLKVISEFLNEVGSRPTWRVIVDALRSPAVRQHQLAREVEAAHFPDATAIREVVPTSTPTVPLPKKYTQSPAARLARRKIAARDASSSSEQLPPTESPEPNRMTSRYVQAKIRQLEKKFNELKRACRSCLERYKVTVKRVVDALTDLPADDVDEHKQFIESHLEVLYQSSNHAELFGALSFNMNYLSPQLLEYIADEFKLGIEKEMEAYKNDMQKFRKKTPLILFCRTQKRHVTPPADFQEVVAKFEWPQNHDDVALEIVEQFREQYACHYKLRECAMMLAEARPNCYIITWYIPQSIVERLRANVPRPILKKYDVTKLEIAGSCVYRLRNKPQEMPAMTPSSVNSGPTTAAASATSHQDSQTMEEKDYPFIEQPSDDFFCPVTYGLLLQPHLTSCCGKHLSQEATTKIQREGGACPLCNAPQWSKMLSKHFQRQVNVLHVFCRHEDRGCGWHGELSALERHIQSCPMTDRPLMTDLLKSSLYKDVDQDDDSTHTKAHGRLATAKPHSIPPLLKSRKLIVQCHRHQTKVPPLTGVSMATMGVSKLSMKSRVGQLTVQCHCKKKAPCGMSRGSATTNHQFAYFIPLGSNSVYSYEWNTEQWNRLPSSPYRNCALVIIDGTLTTVGGYRSGDSGRTNKLFTLRQRQWVEEYPPMNTARSSPAVVSTSGDDYIIVFGGRDGGGWTGTVELFQVKTRRWYELTNIPQPLTYPSATICGNQLHVIGYANGCSCSTENLPSSDKPITSQSIRHLISWTSLPHLPVIQSTAATLYEQLVIIGGIQDWSPVNSIHQLVDGQWVKIGSMSSNRKMCLVASPSPDRMMIVGGWGAEDSVEECVVLS